MVINIFSNGLTIEWFKTTTPNNSGVTIILPLTLSNYRVNLTNNDANKSSQYMYSCFSNCTNSSLYVFAATADYGWGAATIHGIIIGF